MKTLLLAVLMALTFACTSTAQMVPYIYYNRPYYSNVYVSPWLYCPPRYYGYGCLYGCGPLDWEIENRLNTIQYDLDELLWMGRQFH